MDSLTTAIIGSSALIVIVEGFLWKLFRKRIQGICFPREMDASFFRFFTLGRLRAIAISHTLFLLGTVNALYLLLW